MALGEEIGIEFLPAVKEAVNMSFSERNKLGFKMAMKKDLGFFFWTWKRSLCSKLESFFADKRRRSKTVKPYAMQATYDITSAAGKASLQKKENRAMLPKRSFPSKRIHGSRHR